MSVLVFARHGRRLRASAGAAILAACIGVAPQAAPAAAQAWISPETTETGLIRGRVNEDDINRALLGKSSTAKNAPETTTTGVIANSGLQPQPYEPFTRTPGETTDDGTAARSIFDNTEGDPGDILAETPVPTTRPKTALRRSQEARDRLSAKPESAADRRKAEEQARTEQPGVDRSQTVGTIRTGTVDSQQPPARAMPIEREEPIEGLEKRFEENPYEAVGIRVGNFTLRPSVEQGVTVTDNVNSSPDGAEGVLSETTLRLNAISEQAGDLTMFNGYGIYRTSVDGEELDHKEAGIDLQLERVIAEDLKAKADLNYAIRPESFSSPVEIVGSASQPIQQTLAGSVGLAKDVGKLRLGVTAKVDREWYGDADLSTGGTLSQEDRNSTLATVSLRGGYEISPALTPFIEVEAGRRVYDLEKDSAGYERSADHYAVNAGVELDMGEKLNGEFSAGYVTESPDDDRLDAIAGLNMAAKLNWSPERGTLVALTGSTEVEGTTTPGSSGSLLHSARLSVERQMRSNLSANGAVGLAYRDYQSTSDNDLIYSAELGATWWLNRYAGLTARARHETVKSTLANRDSQTNSVFIGLRLQR